MKNHLTPEEISAAAAGLELEDSAREHFKACVVCRSEAAGLEGLIDARRRQVLGDEPDWEVQHGRIMDRLPAAAGEDRRRRPRWFRPALALAAVLVVAVGLGVLRPDGPVETPRTEPSVEEILAEMDELLSSDSIPGFEIIDPETDDLASFFDNGAS